MLVCTFAEEGFHARGRYFLVSEVLLLALFPVVTEE